VTAHQAVQSQDLGQAHFVQRHLFANAATMREHQVALQLFQVFVGDRNALQLAEARGQAVHHVPSIDVILDDLAHGTHTFHGRFGNTELHQVLGVLTQEGFEIGKDEGSSVESQLFHAAWGRGLEGSLSAQILAVCGKTHFAQSAESSPPIRDLEVTLIPRIQGVTRPRPKARGSR
jgi:hypothetical protein